MLMETKTLQLLLPDDPKVSSESFDNQDQANENLDQFVTRRLVMWAVITNKFRISNIFIRHSTQTIKTALLAGALQHRLSREQVCRR
jgi:hypothetical protein